MTEDQKKAAYAEMRQLTSHKPLFFDIGSCMEDDKKIPWEFNECYKNAGFILIQGTSNDIVWHEDGSVTRTITDYETGAKTVTVHPADEDGK